jgi:hypothetical protein
MHCSTRVEDSLVTAADAATAHRQQVEMARYFAAMTAAASS